jgi:serine/threonine-protein kinase
VPDAAPPIAAETVLGGRYRLVWLIAGGGMAQVWEAHDEILARAVAVKVLHPHLAEDTAFLERFRREAVAAARLSHPNVVAVFDTGVDGGLVYIVMELVRGKTLRELLVAQGALGPARAVQIAAQVADALDYAHGQGIVHRDVKPANVLIADDGRVKVADFGIAKAVSAALGSSAFGSSADLTQTGAIVGTAKYLSPEQVNGQPQDRRADVYSLGVVLYEMLCGRPPFAGDSELAIAMQHVRTAPVGPRQVRAGIPRPLEAVVLKALAKAPSDRFDTAGELRGALSTIDLADDDATAMVTRDPTPPEGIRPTFAQTERSWLIPVVVIVLIALALGTVGVLFARNDNVRGFLNPSKSPASSGTSTPAKLVSAQAFDPPAGGGDGSEHNDQARNVIDGDPATAWTTERYASRRFGNLKPGVGIAVQLDRVEKLSQVQVVSPTKGYAVTVYVADAPQSTLDAWGTPVDTKSGLDGDATFDMKGRRGAAVLIWITDLGEARVTQINEVRVAM